MSGLLTNSPYANFDPSKDPYLRRFAGQKGPGRGPELSEMTPQGLLDQAAISSSPFPVAGDIIGLLADASAFAQEPTLKNAGFGLLGALPFVPGAAALRSADDAVGARGVDNVPAQSVVGERPSITAKGPPAPKEQFIPANRRLTRSRQDPNKFIDEFGNDVTRSATPEEIYIADTGLRAEDALVKRYYQSLYPAAENAPSTVKRLSGP